jgi:putative tricarboxylic transport membrane protein
MKINNAVSGIAIGLFGLAVYIQSGSFPTLGQQQIGPEVFPQVIAVGMMICAILLIIKGIKDKKSTGEGWIELPEWAREPRSLFGFLLILIALVFYVLASEWLGFLITGFVMLIVLFLYFQVKPLVALITAVISVFVIHYLFYTVLKVPLPWGILESFAW